MSEEIDLPSIVMDINDPITIEALKNCSHEWEMLSGLHDPRKPITTAELGLRFKALMIRLDKEACKIFLSGELHNNTDEYVDYHEDQLDIDFDDISIHKGVGK